MHCTDCTAALSLKFESRVVAAELECSLFVTHVVVCHIAVLLSMDYNILYSILYHDSRCKGSYSKLTRSAISHLHLRGSTLEIYSDISDNIQDILIYLKGKISGKIINISKYLGICHNVL